MISLGSIGFGPTPSPSFAAKSSAPMGGCGCSKLACELCSPQPLEAVPPVAAVAPRGANALPDDEKDGKGEGRDGNGNGSGRDDGRGRPGNGRASVRLTPEQEEAVAKLRRRDDEVRAHEQAHVAASGGLAGSPSYVMQTGPDGRQYAVGGHVNIDTSAVPNDPAATAAKMAIVQRAATAPGEPSGQDMKVAAQAMQTAAQARIAMARESANGDGTDGEDAGGDAGGRGRDDDRRDPASGSEGDRAQASTGLDGARRRSATASYAAAAQAGQPDMVSGRLADIAA